MKINAPGVEPIDWLDYREYQQTIADKLALLRDFIARNELGEHDIISAGVVCYESVPKLHVWSEVGRRLFAGTGRTPIDGNGYVHILRDGVSVMFKVSTATMPDGPETVTL